jgi:hypothetical protein
VGEFVALGAGRGREQQRRNGRERDACKHGRLLWVVGPC